MNFVVLARYTTSLSDKMGCAGRPSFPAAMFGRENVLFVAKDGVHVLHGRWAPCFRAEIYI